MAELCPSISVMGYFIHDLFPCVLAGKDAEKPVFHNAVWGSSGPY